MAATTAVLGGGISGLSASFRLLRHGKQAGVTLFEATRVGGCIEVGRGL